MKGLLPHNDLESVVSDGSDSEGCISEDLLKGSSTTGVFIPDEPLPFFSPVHPTVVSSALILISFPRT